MEIPIYLFTGFLEAGKTRFLRETLCDPQFFDREGERTLVLMCEEGEEELDPGAFASPEVFVEYIDEEKRVNPDKLEALRAKHRATRVLIEGAVRREKRKNYVDSIAASFILEDYINRLKNSGEL